MAESAQIRTVIACLAQIAVDEYLASEAARLAALEAERPNPVPLPDLAKAA